MGDGECNGVSGWGMGNAMGYQCGGRGMLWGIREREGECNGVSGRGMGTVMGYQGGGGGINGYQGGAGEWGTKVGNREWNGELEVGLLLPQLGARYRCRRT